MGGKDVGIGVFRGGRVWGKRVCGKEGVGEDGMGEGEFEEGGCRGRYGRKEGLGEEEFNMFRKR